MRDIDESVIEYSSDDENLSDDENEMINDASDVCDNVSNIEFDDCKHQQYYLGSYIKTSQNEILEPNGSSSFICDAYLDNWYLIGTRIPLELVYKYTIQRLNYYLYWYSVLELEIPEVHILQAVNINKNGRYEIWGTIIKTHWLRLIQRTWKRVYIERMKCLKNLRNIYSREIGNRVSVPGITGMMSIYSNKEPLNV